VRPRYLIDTSAFLRIPRSRDVEDTIRPLTSRIAICTPALLECMFAAPAGGYDEALRHVRAAFTQITLDDAACGRSIEVQQMLASKSQHRTAKPADLLIAACAETRGLTMLHYDQDFDAIAAVTGQPTMWVVPRGSVP
jgi:predicted nucleic acid-binding protein